MNRRVVGLARLEVSGDPEEVLITYALGSCLGVAIYDPIARVGGLLHAMLPLSSADPERADENPALYVDTGVASLFHACYRAGAVKERIVVKVAGGGHIAEREDEDPFQIGRRNVVILRKLLWQNGVLLRAHDLGGRVSRTVTLAIGSGEVTVRSNGATNRL
jgi:chemotaxis protein CheD